MKKFFLVLMVLALSGASSFAQEKPIIIWEIVNSGASEVDISPDDTYIAVTPDHISGNDKKISIIDLKTGELIKILEGHTKDIKAIAFSRDGKYLASAGHDDFVIIWDVESWEPIKKIPLEYEDFKLRWIWELDFAYGSNLLAIGGESDGILIFDVDNDSVFRKIKYLPPPHHQSTVTISLLFHPTKPYLISSVYYNPFRIVDINTEENVYLDYNEYSPSEVAVSPDGRFIVYGSSSEKGYFKLLDENCNFVKDIYDDIGISSLVQFSQDGKYIIMGKYGIFYETENFTLVKDYDMEGKIIGITHDNSKLLYRANGILGLMHSGLNKIGVDEREIFRFNVFPLPVKNNIKIEFTLQNNALVNIALMDLDGAQVKVLTNGHYEEGGNDLTYDLSTLPNGAYFIRFECNELILTEKIIISK